MALRRCPGCDKMIPWNVQACPFCGRQLIAQRRPWSLYLWLMLLLFALAIAALWVNTRPPSSVLNKDNKSHLPSTINPDPHDRR
jgi:hypothetical protein